MADPVSGSLNKEAVLRQSSEPSSSNEADESCSYSRDLSSAPSLVRLASTASGTMSLTTAHMSQQLSLDICPPDIAVIPFTPDNSASIAPQDGEVNGPNSISQVKDPQDSPTYPQLVSILKDTLSNRSRSTDDLTRFSSSVTLQEPDTSPGLDAVHRIPSIASMTETIERLGNPDEEGSCGKTGSFIHQMTTTFSSFTSASSFDTDVEISADSLANYFTEPIARKLEEEGFVDNRGAHYKFCGRLGQGAFSTVLEAMRDDGRPVAIKVLTETSEESASSLNQEVTLLQSLRHTHIVELLGVAEVGHYVMTVMEVMGGGSLRDILGKVGELVPKQAAAYISDVLSGLDYLHRHNVVHKDIKPENVLLNAEGRCKLADFGSAGQLTLDVQVQNETELDRSLGLNTGNQTIAIRYQTAGNRMGTPLYMAPELVENPKENSCPKACDIWSLGMMLLELVLGHHPWRKDSPDAMVTVIYFLRNREPPKAPAHFPESLREFIAQCLQRDPEQRADAKTLRFHTFVQQWRPAAYNRMRSTSGGSDNYEDSNVVAHASAVDLMKLMDALMHYQRASFLHNADACLEVIDLVGRLHDRVQYYAWNDSLTALVKSTLLTATKLLMQCTKGIHNFDTKYHLNELGQVSTTLAAVLNMSRQDCEEYNDSPACHMESLGEYDEAEKLYLEAIEQDESQAEPYYRLGLIAQNVRKNWAMAQKWYDKCLERDPSHAPSLCEMGRFYFNKDKTVAQRYYSAALQVSGRESEAAFNGLGDINSHRGKLDQVTAKLYRTTGKQTLATKHQKKSIAYCNKACEYYQQALDVNPCNSHALGKLGEILLMRSDGLAAEEKYRQAVKWDPTNASALAGLGWLHFNRKCFASAQSCFADAVMFEPMNSWALCGMGAVTLRLYRTIDTAAHYIDKAISADSHNDWALVYLGIIHHKCWNNYEKARDLYIQALQSNPRNSWALNNLGEIALTQGDLDRAKEFFEETLVVEPGHKYALSNMEKVPQTMMDKSFGTYCLSRGQSFVVSPKRSHRRSTRAGAAPASRDNSTSLGPEISPSRDTSASLSLGPSNAIPFVKLRTSSSNLDVGSSIEVESLSSGGSDAQGTVEDEEQGAK